MMDLTRVRHTVHVVGVVNHADHLLRPRHHQNVQLIWQDSIQYQWSHKEVT